METTTWTDPIVDEVRAVRRALAREFDDDLDRVAAMLMESQQRHGDRLVYRGRDRSQHADLD